MLETSLIGQEFKKYPSVSFAQKVFIDENQSDQELLTNGDDQPTSFTSFNYGANEFSSNYLFSLETIFEEDEDVLLNETNCKLGLHFCLAATVDATFVISLKWWLEKRDIEGVWGSKRQSKMIR